MFICQIAMQQVVATLLENHSSSHSHISKEIKFWLKLFFLYTKIHIASGNENVQRQLTNPLSR
jgi:hypothetical protein